MKCLWRIQPIISKKHKITSQFSLQNLNKISKRRKKIYPPGHNCLWQLIVSMLFPTQSNPPFSGLGSLQFRKRDWLPLPHVTSQLDHWVHTDHCPSTVSYHMITNLNYMCPWNWSRTFNRLFCLLSLIQKSYGSISKSNRSLAEKLVIVG